MMWLFSVAGVESTAVSLYDLYNLCIETAPTDQKGLMLDHFGN